MSHTEIRTDDENLFAWDRITRVYDDSEALISRKIEHDNEIVSQEFFTDGSRTTLVREDLSTLGDAANWQYLETHYDSEGNLLDRFTIFDNNVFKNEYFADGLPTFTFQDDLSSGGTAKNWDRIEIEYDATGNILERVIEFDIETTKTEYYEGGIITEAVHVDTSDQNDAVNWQFIETTYDALGNLEERFTVFDNSVFKTDDFIDGIKTFTSEVDRSGSGDAVNWDTRETNYDADGIIQDRFTELDNGITKLETFDAGVRSYTLLEDESYGSFEKNWQSIETNYDASGVIEDRTTVFDDDTFIFVEYESGVRSTSYREDALGAGSTQNWESIFSEFDVSGNIEARTTTFDDTDVLIFLFDEGQKESKLRVDNSGNSPWEAREVVYDINGDVEAVNTYYDLNDVPDIYDEYGPFLI